MFARTTDGRTALILFVPRDTGGGCRVNCPTGESHTAPIMTSGVAALERAQMGCGVDTYVSVCWTTTALTHVPSSIVMHVILVTGGGVE
jgi:hypothetical protein